MSELIHYKHPVTGQTFGVDEEALLALDVLERAGRWVDYVDLERWATGDSLGWGDDYSRLVEAGIIEERWLDSDEGRFRQLRLSGLVQEPFTRGRSRRRMMFAVGHPGDLGEADFKVLGDRVESIWWGLELFGYEDIHDWVEGDPSVLVACQDTRALDAATFEDWRDLQARLVLVRPGGALATLTELEAQELMRDLPLQPLSQLVYERGLTYDPADRLEREAEAPPAKAAIPAPAESTLPAAYSIEPYTDGSVALGGFVLYRIAGESKVIIARARSRSDAVRVDYKDYVPLSALVCLGQAARTGRVPPSAPSP